MSPAGAGSPWTATRPRPRSRILRRDLALWLEEYEYESLEQMKGSMSLLRCLNPGAHERANYMSVLQSWWG